LFASIIIEHKNTLGNVDAGTVAHDLPRYYEGVLGGSIWDIGANKGDTSQVLIAALVPGFFCLKFYSLTDTVSANCRRWAFPFFAAEMNPATVAVLNKRATFERWDMLSYIVISAGFSDKSGTIKIKLSDDPSDSEIASLALASTTTSSDSSSGVVDIPLFSVDDYRKTRGESDAPIFLLKIDTEGFDGKVIKGAHKALAAHRVKFVIAEYNSMWASVVTSPGGAPEWSLQKTTQYLFKLGYECHLMNLQHFIPLWGEWWQDEYEFWGHSNFMCAVMCDKDMRHLIAVTRNASLQGLERDDC